MKNSTKKYVYGAAAVVTGIGTIAADAAASKYLKKHLGKSSKTVAGIAVSSATSIGIHSTLGGITALLIAGAVESHELDKLDKKSEEYGTTADEYEDAEDEMFDEDLDLDDEEDVAVTDEEDSNNDDINEVESDPEPVKSSEEDGKKSELEKESDYELKDDDIK